MRKGWIAALTAAVLTVTAYGQKDFYTAAKHGGNYMHNFYLPPAPSSTPWAPAWSPDGRSIAVSWMGSIWKVDAATGDAVELTDGRTYDSSPAWSPDGRWIVYTADEDHQRVHLGIVNLETGQSSVLEQCGLCADPAWSPDGTKLAFVSTAPNGYFNIYVQGIRNGSWTGEAIPVTRDNRYPRDRLYFGAWDMYLQPAWTPDGKDLLFLSNRNVPLGSGHIWRMPAVANGVQDARPILQEQSLYRARPDVSPDGKRFVYSSSGGAADAWHHLYVLPVNGGTHYKMTFGDHDDFHPRWSPDGERIAYISNEGGLPRLMLLETYGGGKRRIGLKPVQWKRPVGILELEVVDERGQPAHARIQGSAADGKFYAPPDAYARIGYSGEHFFHTPGRNRWTVPAGRTELTAIHGFEYWPAPGSVEVPANGTAKLRLVVRRMANLAREGWHSGSTHVHMNYGGNLRNTLENLLFMSKAEGQDVVNELVANKDNRILDWMYFEKGGGEHPVSKSDPSIVLLVGEEYRPPFFGHVFYLGLKDHLISPFTTGYEGTGIESLYPSNTDMFRKAKAQGAVTGYVHPHSGEKDPLEEQLGVGKGFPVDVALETTDAYEWSNSSRGQLKVWHKVLNSGFSITPTGGEDSISNLHYSKVVGSVRTYAQWDGPLTVANWLEALRWGATYYSSGPLLEFTVNGKGPGEELRLSAGGARIRLAGKVRSWAPLSHVVIYRNGAVFRELPLRSAEPGGDGLIASIDEQVQVDESSWFTLYADGEFTPLLDVNYPQASTNAIRVIVGDHPIRDKDSADYFVQWIDKLEAMAKEWPWWRSDKEKTHVFGQFEEARNIWRKRAAEAKE